MLSSPAGGRPRVVKVGGMYVPRVNGMIMSNRSTRDVSVGEERKKRGAGAGGRGNRVED